MNQKKKLKVMDLQLHNELRKHWKSIQVTIQNTSLGKQINCIDVINCIVNYTVGRTIECIICKEKQVIICKQKYVVDEMHANFYKFKKNGWTIDINDQIFCLYCYKKYICKICYEICSEDNTHCCRYHARRICIHCEIRSKRSLSLHFN